MRIAKLPSTSRTDQFPVPPLAPHPQTQGLGSFIDFVPVNSVARPSQDFREFVVAHSAESSRTAPTTETRFFIASLRIPAQSQKRIAALRPFVQCIRNNLLIVTGVTVDVPAFNDLPSHLYQIYGKDPAFMAFLRSLLYILDFTPTKDKISFICDDEEQMALPFYQMYRKIQRIWPGARDKQAAISFVDSRVQEPYQTMFTIAWCTGLRAGELLALTVEDLDFSSRTIIVNKSADDNTRRVGPTKTNTSTALLPMPSALESRLRTYLEKHWRDNPSKLLFPNRKGTHPLWQQRG